MAAQQIPVILGFDYQTIERSRTDAYNLLAPDFRREYEDDTTKNVIPQARERQIISQVNVVGVGVLDAHRDSGSVMVFMNRVLTDKTKQPLYDGSRLRVDYQKVGQRLADQGHHPDVGVSAHLVPASASRNERAHRSTSWASTCLRIARIRRRPSSGVCASAASMESLTPSR